MKKRLLLFFFVILLGISALVSCGEEAPEGLSVVSTENPDGIKFYCPEGWSVVSDRYNGEYRVYAAKYPARGITSITFTEAPMPNGDIAEYFHDSLSSAVGSIKDTLKVTKEPTAELFGNAKESYKVIYTYKYEDKDYVNGGYKVYDVTCMQYFIKHDGRFYIFTYSAYGSPDDEAGDYRKHLESVSLAVKHFEFGKKANEDKPQSESTSDKFVLVSDKTLCGYDLYLPEKYRVIGSNGDVEAKISNGASLSLTRVNDTVNLSFFEYIDVKKKELSGVVGEISDISVVSSHPFETESEVIKNWKITVTPTVDESLKLGSLESVAVAYEYSYEWEGVTYRVYQLHGMTRRAGFVFTYTAPADEYESHFDTIKEIIKRAEF